MMAMLLIFEKWFDLCKHITTDPLDLGPNALLIRAPVC